MTVEEAKAKVEAVAEDALQEEVFQFLVDLRDSGETNMWGARPYVESEFGMSKKEAGEWCTKWMRSFDDAV